ncbi:MAG: hypothetical protein Fur0040_06780 [Sideroxydans sp.]
MGLTGKFLAMLGLSDQVRAEISREINLFEAVEAHVAWKRRLVEYLEGRSSEKLEAHHVCLDNRCVLGKWIHGPGKVRLGEYPVFQQLVDEHAKFHYYASKVIEAHDAGDDRLSRQLLDNEFAHQSKKTVNCITRLHMQIEGKE